MATTVTVGFGTAAFAAAGAAAAGAVGLALLALTRRRSRSRESYRYRTKRQTSSKKGIPKKDSEEKILQRVVNLIRSQDVTGCGLKMVCELAGLREDELDREQRHILSLVDQTPNDDGGGIGDYKAAMTIGQTQGNCSENFPLCALNGTQLMQIVDGFLP